MQLEQVWDGSPVSSQLCHFLLSMTALRPEHVPALIHASSNTPHGVASKRKLAHGVPLRQGHQLSLVQIQRIPKRNFSLGNVEFSGCPSGSGSGGAAVKFGGFSLSNKIYLWIDTSISFSPPPSLSTS